MGPLFFVLVVFIVYVIERIVGYFEVDVLRELGLSTRFLTNQKD